MLEPSYFWFSLASQNGIIYLSKVHKQGIPQTPCQARSKFLHFFFAQEFSRAPIFHPQPTLDLNKILADEELSYI